MDAFGISTKNMGELISMAKTNYDILVEIVNRVIGNGSPKEVFDTYAELVAKYPKGAKGIYLVTETGYWYFWDDEWISGGVYQATQLSDGSVTEVKLDIGLQNKINLVFQVQQEAQQAQEDINSHKLSTQAHNAMSITYNGLVINANNVKQAIDSLKQMINTLVTHAGDGTKDSELILARGEYDVLPDRLDAVDAQLAENANLIVYVTDKRFGAKGDGVTDDTDAIQSALDYVYANGGGTVCLPSIGTFIFTSINIKANITFKSYGAVLKLKDGTLIDDAKSYYLVHNMSGDTWYDNVAIDSLVIDANKVNNTSFAVADSITVGGNNVSVKDCHLYNVADSGIMLSGGKNSSLINNRIDGARDLGIYINDGLSGVNLHECIVAFNRITNCSNGGIATKRTSSKIIISENVIFNCGNGITLEQVAGGDYSTNLEIIGNRLRKISLTGIYLIGSESVICANNKLEDILETGVSLVSIKKCVINGNIVKMDSTATSSSNAIIMTSSSVANEHNIISSNVFINTMGTAIRLSDTTNVHQLNIFTNNQCIGRTGLRIEKAWERNIFKQNIFNGTTADLDNNSGSVANSNLFSENILANNRNIGYTDHRNSMLFTFFNGDSTIASMGKVAVAYSDAMPTSGTYTQGDIILNPRPTEKGTAGAKYSVLGWRRLTTGNTHTLNTDWLELRCVTGN